MFIFHTDTVRIALDEASVQLELLMITILNSKFSTINNYLNY